jgi:hypothetical protein
MISLGRRGAVPKDQQIKAIHIECDREVQFELKVVAHLRVGKEHRLSQRHKDAACSRN